MIAALNRIRGPFNVTRSGQCAALAALADQAFVDASREHNRVERTRFAEAVAALGNHGLRVVPSETNFVLVLFEGPLGAAEALAGLATRGYAVRHLPGLGRVCAFGWSDDAPAVVEQRGEPRVGPAVLGAGDRVRGNHGPARQRRRRPAGPPRPW